MSDKSSYSPIGSLRRLREAMQEKIMESGELVIPGETVAAPIVSVQPRADTCCVLLKMLTDGGPVPDDIKGLTSATALRAHTRSDGAVYRGAYEVQGRPESVVLVFGDPTLPDVTAERLASLERPALESRYAAWQLGPFANRPVPVTPVVS